MSEEGVKENILTLKEGSNRMAENIIPRGVS
jgi:hypothetical protein